MILFSAGSGNQKAEAFTWPRLFGYEVAIDQQIEIVIKMLESFALYAEGNSLSLRSLFFPLPFCKFESFVDLFEREVI